MIEFPGLSVHAEDYWCGPQLLHWAETARAGYTRSAPESGDDLRPE